MYIHTNVVSMTIDSHYSAQDVLRCRLCETPVSPLFCHTCSINKYKACVGEHKLDESKEYKVMQIKQRWSTFNFPTCLNHSMNIWTSMSTLWCSRVCTLYFFSETPISWSSRYQQYFGKTENALMIDLEELENKFIQNIRKLRRVSQIGKLIWVKTISD